MDKKEQEIREIVADLKKLNLEKTAITSLIDGMLVMFRNLDPRSQGEIDNLLEHITATEKRLLDNRNAVVKLKEKFDELRKNL